MKKKKALLIATMLASIALTSCGEQTYHGTYQFQMGKQAGSHIGIYMDLTGDNIQVEVNKEKVNMEKFTLRFSTPTGDNNGQGLVGNFLSSFENGLSGGYKIEYLAEKNENHLTLVPVIDISQLMAMAESSEEGDSSSQESTSSQEEFVIPSEYVDDILIATFDNNTINVTVPVSLNDLMFQLYWYGFDIFDPLGEYEIEKHEHGTHPTAEDVKKINETFNAEDRTFKHLNLDALMKYKAALYPIPVVEYRDFNQLTMSLSKAEL